MLRSLFNRSAHIQTRTQIRGISARELKERLDAGERPLLLDVRSSMEFQHDGHIPGSHLLPLPALGSRLDELPKDQTIVCVCRSGNRSRFACEQLAAAGFNDIINLNGGILSWRNMGRLSRK